MIVLKCKGRKIKGVIEPDLPEHTYYWRICEYDSIKNEFKVYEDLPDGEIEKVAEYIHIEEMKNLESRVAKVKRILKKLRI